MLLLVVLVVFDVITLEFTSMDIHPDGLLLATGSTTGQISIWDIKTQKVVKDFKADSTQITNLTFSENGYYLASSCEGEFKVRIWDLRKLTNIHTIDVDSTENISFFI